MDKTPVHTASLEEELLENILSGSMERGHVETLIADFRSKFEEECFQAWDIAQAFKIDTDHNRFLDEQRVFNMQREGFYAAVGAYNREREKEGKLEHKYTHPDLPEDCTAPEECSTCHECQKPLPCPEHPHVHMQMTPDGVSFDLPQHADGSPLTEGELQAMLDLVRREHEK